jgi:hypothetical protein
MVQLERRWVVQMCGVDDYVLTAYVEGTSYYFRRFGSHAFSYFGGPSEYEITGMDHGPKRLHHIATIHGGELPALRGTGNLGGLPLIYGMCFDGCRMKYKVTRYELELSELQPTTSSDNWPYPDFPTLLPYFPLEVFQSRTEPYRAWADRFPNLALDQPTDLVVAIPPPANIGVTLWGGFEDAEGVVIVFECDLKAHEVKAYNVCT